MDVLSRKILSGNRAALSKGITLVESSLQRHRILSKDLLKKIQKSNLNSKRPSIRVGICGSPGAGKSSLIETLGTHITETGKKLAVLAIDPSSSITGGSVLGDKTRMQHLSTNPNVYIRPSPSKGTLGGVAQYTNDAMVLCEGSGYDVVLVETVGLGQSEIAVRNLVDIVVLVIPPAAGDMLQGMKKGVVEIADFVLVNKSDGELEKLSNRTKIEYLHALQLLRRKNAQPVKVEVCSSVTGKNVPVIWEEMVAIWESRAESGEILKNREQQILNWLWDEVRFRVLERIRESENAEYEKIEKELVDCELSTREAAEAIIRQFLSNSANFAMK